MNNYNRLWKVRIIGDALFILLVSLSLFQYTSLYPWLSLPLCFHSFSFLSCHLKSPSFFTNSSLLSLTLHPSFSLSTTLPPTLRAPGHLVGLIRTILPSVRPAWTSLPAGLAPCPWSILRWGWTQSCSKTRCPYCGRSTGILRDYNPPEPPRSLDTIKKERGGGHIEKRRASPWLHGWINGEANGIGYRGRGGKETKQMWRTAHPSVSSVMSFVLPPFLLSTLSLMCIGG